MGITRFLFQNVFSLQLGMWLRSDTLYAQQPAAMFRYNAMSSQRSRPARRYVELLQDVVQAPPHTEPLSKLHSLSVILPVYNEEAVIGQTIQSVTEALSRWTDDFEILIVNDGSLDQTHEIVEQLLPSNDHLRLLQHPSNRGYGAALVTGFQAVTRDLVFFMDADGQFDITDLEKFFPLIGQYDAVLGYRDPRVDSWLRKLNAWGWKMIVFLLLGVHVRDLDCAFKLYRADFFRYLQLETRGAMINAEVIYKFKRDGYTFTEVGVKHLPRMQGEATGAKPRVILSAFRELFHYAWQWKKEERARRMRKRTTLK